MRLENFIGSTVLAKSAENFPKVEENEGFEREYTEDFNETFKPQISRHELKHRIEFFIKLLHTTTKGKAEDDQMLDEERCELIVRSVGSGAKEAGHFNISLESKLSSLIFLLACDVLESETICSEVDLVKDKIIEDYRSRGRVWLSAYQNASIVLRPLLLRFCSWLRENKESLVVSIQNDKLLSCLDQKLRRKLKEQVYHSADHFLEVFESFEHLLTDVKIELSEEEGKVLRSDSKLEQTMKDIKRERFVFGGMEVGPDELVFQLKSELRKIFGERSGENVEKKVEGVFRLVLNSASRTTSGGDSFFVVNDLFGGEGVLIKPTREPQKHIEIDFLPGPAISVTAVNTYDIFHLSDVVEADDDRPVALMTIETTAKENFVLHGGESLGEMICAKEGRFLSLKACKPKRDSVVSNVSCRTPALACKSRKTSSFEAPKTPPVLLKEQRADVVEEELKANGVSLITDFDIFD
mmetsp:Transcript_19226/g.28378  ORF Transcript_19226/g.28378 Transcript_19226/m.28378 type:complete len:468 (+) Transcript_19226:28-1431(+)